VIAFHGEPQLKAHVIQKMREHREADRLIQHFYWKNGRGCAVGCLLQDPYGGHERYETEFGIPRQLALLEDGIFECLDIQSAVAWPERFLEAIPVGADLSLVWPRFAVWMLVDPQHGIGYLLDDPSAAMAVSAVVDLYSRQISGDEPGSEEWEAALVAVAAIPDLVDSSIEVIALGGADVVEAGTIGIHAEIQAEYLLTLLRDPSGLCEYARRVDGLPESHFVAAEDRGILKHLQALRRDQSGSSVTTMGLDDHGY
jgi:hypothetical protein